MKTVGYEPEKYWEERLSKNFTLSGVGFWGLGVAYNCWLYKSRIRSLSKLLKENKINIRGKRVLELGVGNGFYVEYWKKQGASSVVGLDITEKSISSLKTKYPQYEFIKADISSKELSINGTFDLITAFDVLFHIIEEENFKQTIENIRTLASPETKILITDSFLRGDSNIGFHECDRTLKKYQEVLKNNGIKIVNVEPIFYFMSNPIDITVIKNKFLRCLLPYIWISISRTLKLSNSKAMRPLSINYLVGHIFGFALYLLDGLILKFAKDGPSLKLLLAQLEEY